MERKQWKKMTCKVLVVTIMTILCTYACGLCEESRDTDDVQKKSYVLALTGALITPALGHSYIGGDNVRRGIWYSSSEVLMVTCEFLGRVAYGLSGFSADGEESDFKANYCLRWALATHAISAVDALISVRKTNTDSEKKSYFISTGGSALFPVIGHGYLSPKNNARGWLYSFGEVIFSLEDKPDVVRTIRYISMLDAFVSTYHYNKTTTKVLLVPGVSSVDLMIIKTF